MRTHRIEFYTYLLRSNFRERNIQDPHWRRIYRSTARHAIRELRYLTERPAKRITR